MLKTDRLAFLGVILSLSLISVLTYAQLGQFATPGGVLYFNVTMGQSETQPWTIFNSGNTTITFNVIAPSMVIKPSGSLSLKNRTPPEVTITPSSGVLVPRQNMVLNITVYMPTKNNTAGLRWEAIPEAVVAPNQSNPGGAVIQLGVGKILSITAIQAPTNYTMYAIAGVIVIVVACGAFYVIRRRKGGEAKMQIRVSKPKPARPKRGR